MAVKLFFQGRWYSDTPDIKSHNTMKLIQCAYCGNAMIAAHVEIRRTVFPQSLGKALILNVKLFLLVLRLSHNHLEKSTR